MDFKDLNKNVDTTSPWKLIEHHENPNFDSGFGMKIFTDRVIDPHGKPTTYSYVVKPDFISAVIINNNNEVYLVGQYRYPLKEYTWEVVKGGINKGESLKEATQRETEEETGLKISCIELLQGNVILGANKTYRGHIFLVHGIDAIGKQNLDSSENITVKKIPLRDAINMVFNGEIRDSFSCLSILLAAKKLGFINANK